MTLDVMLPPPPDAQPGPEGQPPAPKRSKVPAVLGLVIDLTNSSRYYDARQWHERGVQYIKASGGVAAAGWAGRRKPSRAGSWCACLAADQRASGCDAVFDGKGHLHRLVSTLLHCTLREERAPRHLAPCPVRRPARRSRAAAAALRHPPRPSPTCAGRCMPTCSSARRAWRSSTAPTASTALATWWHPTWPA